MTNAEPRQARLSQRAGLWAWLALALLTLGAWLAGGGFAESLCYWQARLMIGKSRGAVLQAHSPDLLTAEWLFFGFGVLWTIVWLAYAMQPAQRGRSLWRPALPMAVFFMAAWYGSKAAYACYPF